jgi:hypothetical protein
MDHTLTPDDQEELARLRQQLLVAEVQLQEASGKPRSIVDNTSSAKLKEAGLTAISIRERISTILAANDR